MHNGNMIKMEFNASAENESLARMVISALLMQQNPPLSLVSEVRTAVSEAVTNAVVHSESPVVVLRASLDSNLLSVEVEDFGCGIDDIKQAMQPFFTTQPDEERTGIGFALMQSFMDSVHVVSSPGNGTLVKMTKLLTE